MRETGRRGVENTCKKHARKKGWLVRKWRSPGNNGVADDLLFKMGKTLVVEFKAPGKEPTELQDIEIKDLLAHGIDVVWVDNLADFEAVLDSRDPEHRSGKC